MNACAAGHGECVRVLLKAGADPFKDVLVPDARRGQKGLHTTDNAYLRAFHNGHREVVGILRETPQYVRSRFTDVRGRLQGTPPSSLDERNGTGVDEPSPQSCRGQPPCEIVQRTLG